MSCAALNAGLGLHIVTTLQLARVVVAATEALINACANGPEDSVSLQAWEYLRGLATSSLSSSSNSAAGWPLLGQEAGSTVLLGSVNLVAISFDPAAVPQRYRTLLADLIRIKKERDIPSDFGGASANTQTQSGSMQPGATAGSSAAGMRCSSMYKIAMDLAGIPTDDGVDMSLPLDDCALLRQHCSNLGPVLQAVASWMADDHGPTHSGPLHAGFRQYMAAEVHAAARSNKVVSDGPRRRTIMPRYAPTQEQSFSSLEVQLDSSLLVAFMGSKTVSNEVRKCLAQLVACVAKQVARELVVEKGSAGYEALLQAAMYGGGWRGLCCIALNDWRCNGLAFCNSLQGASRRATCCSAGALLCNTNAAAVLVPCSSSSAPRRGQAPVSSIIVGTVQDRLVF